MNEPQEPAEGRPQEGSRVVDITPKPMENVRNQDKALKGHSVQIVEIDNENHSFRLDEEALTEILSDDQIKDLPVCVVSVAGNFEQF